MYYNYLILKKRIMMSKNRLKEIIKIYQKTPENKSNSGKIFDCFDLGFDTFDAFQVWCNTNNIPAKKSFDLQHKAKLSAMIRVNRFEHTLQKSKVKKVRLELILSDLKNCVASVQSFPKNTPFIHDFQKIEDENIQENFISIVKKIPKNHKILIHNTPIYYGLSTTSFFYSLLFISKSSEHWVRDLESWSPKSKNPLKLFQSLVDHLFVQFPVHPIFYSLFFRGGTRPRIQEESAIAFVNIAKGNSIKDSLQKHKLFSKLTNKEYAKILKVVGSPNIDYSIRHIMLSRYTTNKRIIQEVFKSRYADDSSQDVTLFEFLSFISKEEMFDVNQIFPLFDYILELRETYIRDDKQFILKNRNINTLLNGMNEWHRSVGQNTMYPLWKGSNIAHFNHIIKHDNPQLNTVYSITELTTSHALYAEGNALNHCVATYARSCYLGHSFIFSLEKNYLGMKKKILTIELNKSMNVVQIRGNSNRSATKSELNIINKWCKDNHINGY